MASNVGTAVLLALGLALLFQHYLLGGVLAAPSSDGVSGLAGLAGVSAGSRGSSSRARRFPVFPVISTRVRPGRVRLAQLDPALDVAMDDDDGLFELNKRQMSDDYGHMRFGKRGEGEFDDYGHMRFGRSSESAPAAD